MQVRELREMTSEYEVQDLSQPLEQQQDERQEQMLPPPSFQSVSHVDLPTPTASAAPLASAPRQQQLITSQQAAPTAPTASISVHQAFRHDLDAVYGTIGQRVMESFNTEIASASARSFEQSLATASVRTLRQSA